MPQWATFAGLTGVVLVLLLALSYLTQAAFDDADRLGSPSGAEPVDADPRASHEPDLESAAVEADSRELEPRPDTDWTDVSDADGGVDSDADATGRPDGVDDARTANGREVAGADPTSPASLSTGELLANVAFSQGLFAALLIGAAVYTGIPADALGIAFTREYLVTGLLLGTGVGIVLYVANEVGAASAKRFGFHHDESLREMLAPETAGGWLVLLVVVLPIIAVFEELLFRAALIGALSAGFDLSPWLLAVGSSIAFGVGHGMQGRVGIVVTGSLGFVLAAVFILTESLLVVVVAHYLINALEFVVHEGLDVEWTETIGS